ncbi:hypothetical protein BH24ACT1_BH24ACT1_05170 [soil metagenome]
MTSPEREETPAEQGLFCEVFTEGPDQERRLGQAVLTAG